MHSMIRQRSDAREARTRNPSFWTWTTAHLHKAIKIFEVLSESTLKWEAKVLNWTILWDFHKAECQWIIQLVQHNFIAQKQKTPKALISLCEKIGKYLI